MLRVESYGNGTGRHGSGRGNLNERAVAIEERASHLYHGWHFTKAIA